METPRLSIASAGDPDPGAGSEWVVLPDPHDRLRPEFAERVLAYVDQHPDLDLVMVRPRLWDATSGIRRDSLPAGWMYEGDPVVDLADDPDRFPVHPTGAVLRTETLRASGAQLTGDRPGFDHAGLVAEYLLSLESPRVEPRVGFLADGGYDQRRLEPTRERRWRADPRRYETVLPAMLALLEGPRPVWLQRMLVAELGRFVAHTDSQAPTGVPTAGPVAERLHEQIARLLAALDPGIVESTRVWIREPGRAVLAHGWESEPWHETPRLGPVDGGLQRVSWYFTGTRPDESLASAPVHAKVRDLDYYGRALLHERILWLPEHTEIALDGVPAMPIPYAAPAEPEPEPTTREGRTARRTMARRSTRRRYADAWVFLDRIYNTGDSAEVLFRHVRATHPEINAWFVLEEGGPEWERFSREGEADRLVAYGTQEWRLLMANAAHLISTHVDEPIVHPPAIEEFTRPRWRFHFLQHGLIKDDLSAWLNPKPIATLVTSSPQEYASIAGDHTPYVFTTHEVVETGMPRFDRLLRIGAQYPPERRDLLLVAPTWRSGLSSYPEEGEVRRELKDDVLDSDYVRSWTAFLSDPDLAAACLEHGVRLAFLPHPNMQPLLGHLDLPDQVQPLSYEGNDVQHYYARARALVTDFSSVAFNAAYLDRPLVYYQFDEDVVLGGGHMGRGGYFEYRRDGFGPVTTTRADAVTAVREALDHGPAPQPPYQARIEATFPVRDGGCCERVVAAIRRTESSTSTPVGTPVMPPPVRSPHA